MAFLIVDLRIKRLDSRIGMRGCGLETDAADVEIFLKAIELQEVGKFQSAETSAHSNSPTSSNLIASRKISTSAASVSSRQPRVPIRLSSQHLIRKSMIANVTR